MSEQTNPHTEQNPTPEEDRLAIEAISKHLSHTPEAVVNPDDPFLGPLQTIREHLELPDDVSVAYPGSATHTTVAEFFGKDKVVHIDPDEGTCKALRASGYQAVAQTIEDYIPTEPHDLIVTLNSYGTLTEEKVRQVVKPGGYIVTNNYTYWAGELAAMTDTVELKAAILPAWSDASAKFIEGEAIPDNATDIVTKYLKISREAKITNGTPEDHDLAQPTPAYPDGLFVFQRV